jgi:hypothetical protein
MFRRGVAVSARVRVVYNFEKRAPLAQLDRASGYEPEGREFESLRAHHSFQLVTARTKILKIPCFTFVLLFDLGE